MVLRPSYVEDSSVGASEEEAMDDDADPFEDLD